MMDNKAPDSGRGTEKELSARWEEFGNAMNDMTFDQVVATAKRLGIDPRDQEKLTYYCGYGTVESLAEKQLQQGAGAARKCLEFFGRTVNDIAWEVNAKVWENALIPRAGEMRYDGLARVREIEELTGETFNASSLPHVAWRTILDMLRAQGLGGDAGKLSALRDRPKEIEQQNDVAVVGQFLRDYFADKKKERAWRGLIIPEQKLSVLGRNGVDVKRTRKISKDWEPVEYEFVAGADTFRVRGAAAEELQQLLQR